MSFFHEIKRDGITSLHGIHVHTSQQRQSSFGSPDRVARQASEHLGTHSLATGLVPTLIYVYFRLKAAHHTRVHTSPLTPASPQAHCTTTPHAPPKCIGGSCCFSPVTTVSSRGANKLHMFPSHCLSPCILCFPHCIYTVCLYYFVNRHLWHAHRHVACLSNVSSPMTLMSSGMFLFNCPLIE